MGLDGKSWLGKCLLLRWFELGLGSGVSFGFRGVLGFEVGNGYCIIHERCLHAKKNILGVGPASGGRDPNGLFGV